jgi:ubiquinone/menaquinone biosynthesis C-methylase UbiE
MTENIEQIEKTKNYYDGIAKGYKNLYHEEQILKLNYVKDLFPKQGKVLDAGCGDGVLNQFINSDCDLFSFDLSSELLNLNSNLKDKKFCGSLTDLSIFENKYFDFISSFSVIQDIPNFELVFDEMCRVLKDDGTLFLSFVKFSSKKEKILEQINLKFKIIEEFEETKDFIFVLKLK